MKKTVKYSKKGINKLPNNRPVLYKILTDSNKNNYTGIAKRGRVNERITEHLGKIPGAKVQIEQISSVGAAAEKELNVIVRTNPKYNKKKRKLSLNKPV